MLCGLDAWGRTLKRKVDEKEKIQGKIIKEILQLSISTPYTGIKMQTGLCPAKENVEYKFKDAL